MGTIADKLNYLKTTISDLKGILIGKDIGVTESTPLRECVEKVENLSQGVPKGFTELQYLEKTVQDASYIDLLYKATGGTKIELGFTIKSWTNNTQGLIGYDTGSTLGSFAMYLWKEATTDTNKVCSAGVIGSSLSTPEFVQIQLNQPHTYSLGGGSFKINDSTIYTYVPSEGTTPGNLFVFRLNSSNSYYSNAASCVSGKIYGLKIYESDELVRNFVPVQRKDTGDYGLYDTVTGYFLTTSLNSSFTGVAKE